MTNQTPLNPDGVLNAMDTLMAETDADADERATEWAHKVTTRVLEGYFAVAPPVAPMSEGERRVRELHHKEPARYYGTDLNPNNEFDCSCCGEGSPWPCVTIRVLDGTQQVIV